MNFVLVGVGSQLLSNRRVLGCPNSRSLARPYVELGHDYANFTPLVKTGGQNRTRRHAGRIENQIGRQTFCIFCVIGKLAGAISGYC